MKKRRNNLYYPLFVAALVAVISGCGSESDDTNNSSNISQHIVIETRAALDDASIDSLTTIDLSDAVKTEENIELRLDSVTPLSEHNKCLVLSMKGLNYTVETDVSQVCRFEYTVIPVEAQYSGKAYGSSEVLVSDNGSDRIAPIPKKMTQGEVLSVDIAPYLPSGAQLDTTSLELRGVTDSGELGEAVAINNTINYTAPSNTFGQVQIYYTAPNNTSGMLYSGVIYIAISLDVNTAPTADQNTELETLYMANEATTLTIDVASYVSDPDGDSLQLIDVYATSSGWAEVLPSSTSFLYTPNAIGMHNITYVVSDLRGGLAIGTIFFEVDTYKPIYDSANNKTFLPTLTFEELDQNEGVYTSVNAEDGTQGRAGIYPLFSRSLAEAYCVTKGGYLPTSAELGALFNGELGGQSVWSSEYRWPAGYTYVTANGSISLFDGAITTDSIGYVSCAQKEFSVADYNFVKDYYQAEFDKAVLVTASASFNGYEYPLATEKYDLQVETITTNPLGLESLIEVSIDSNRVTIVRTNDSVKTASVKISDPSVQGATDETVLIAGLTECPANVTVSDTQVLGCVPVIYARDYSKAFTAALSDSVLERIGLDLYQGRPHYFRSTNSIPNYTYFDPDTIFSYSWASYVSTAEIHQRLCDIYNENRIGGRVNWVMADTRSDTVNPATEYLVGTLASELTLWLSEQGVGTSGDTGQGYLVNNRGYVQQVNQYSTQNRVIYQGGLFPYDKYQEFSYLTCFSPD